MKITLPFIIIVLLFSCNRQIGKTNKTHSKFVENKFIGKEYNLSSSDSANLIEIQIGELNLPTGEIIVGDPFFIFNAKPLNVKVTPGQYPVNIYLAKIEEDHYRVAYAKIKFDNKKASKWLPAVTEDTTEKDLHELADDEFFGFPVDAGLSCFVDKVTNDAYNKLLDDFYANNPNSNYYNGVMADEFKEQSGSNPYSNNIGNWNNHIVDKDKNLNMIIFSSGWGDGYYPTYWGLSNNNELIELSIDFMLNLEE